MASYCANEKSRRPYIHEGPAGTVQQMLCLVTLKTLEKGLAAVYVDALPGTWYLMDMALWPYMVVPSTQHFVVQFCVCVVVVVVVFVVVLFVVDTGGLV